MQKNNPAQKQMSLCNQEKCLGCMACQNVCPCNAIEIYIDKDKTVYPKILDEQCISCGLCNKVCPVINPVKGNEPKEGLACYTRDEYDKRTCSSGGIATSLYRTVLAEGGFVVGTMAKGMDAPVLQMTNQDADIERFKGSKYVYVNPQKIYKEVESELKRDKTVLFIGAPCQVDALKHILMKEYNKLYTVDIICHGTPPFEYLHEYINELAKKRTDNVSYSFRDPLDFKFSIYNNKKLIYKRRSDEDLYFFAYLQGLIHREICYQCPYAQAARMSDLTIGDYWGADPTVLGGYRGKISAVMINSEKGKRLWDLSSNRLRFEKASVQAIINGNNPLRKPSPRHTERKKFLEELHKTGNFVLAINKTSLPNTIRRNRIVNILKYIPRKIKRKIFEPIKMKVISL